MNLIPILSAFGLSETEAQIYLKILELGKAEASAIFKHTHIKRPTVYHALETLAEKGLVHIVGHANIAIYEAEQPQQLKVIAQRKRDELLRLEKKIDTHLPFFPTSTNTNYGLPHIDFYQGREGLKNLVEQVVNNKEKKLYAIVPDLKNVQSTFSEEFMTRFLDLKKTANIDTQSIWNGLLKNKYYNQHKFFKREIRLAPTNMKNKYKSIILIWDNKVAVLSGVPELYGFLVTSFDYSETMKVVWHTLWKISTPIRKNSTL